MGPLHHACIVILRNLDLSTASDMEATPFTVRSTLDFWIYAKLQLVPSRKRKQKASTQENNGHC